MRPQQHIGIVDFNILRSTRVGNSEVNKLAADSIKNRHPLVKKVLGIDVEIFHDKELEIFYFQIPSKRIYLHIINNSVACFYDKAHNATE